ncbi:hypothetical protein V494_08098 [Pseudogymnoascus sp. VKM F-4513 (FW-928)]|nr:hypothetical protein V494_08098 [Pseudogymnoascus sp. VKM F-4513 (FW-928)]
MASGVGGYLNQKHRIYGGNENDAPPTRQELAQREAAVREMGLKMPGPGAGRRSQSTSAAGVPFRDAVNGPARAGSPLAMQQAYAQNGFQNRNQINGQNQAYGQSTHLWAESTLGSDSLGTARDGQYGQLNSDDNELGDAQGQHDGHGQDVGLSDQQSDSDPEEEEVDEDVAGYQQNFNAHPKPGIHQTSIPVRGHTGRFVTEAQIQRRQSPVTEPPLSNGRRGTNGAGQSYNQRQMSGGHGSQQQDVDRFAPSEVDEDTIHSIASNGGRNHPRKGSKRRADDLDFDQETLFKMSHEELKNQPFDADPSQVKTPVNPSLADLPESLDERMELFKNRPAEERAEFFASLSIDEWEEAGEWLMKQFGTVMGKVAESRRNRRKTALRYESMMAERDAEIREKTDDVTAALKDLKNGGQDLLRGKTPN